MHYLHKNPGLEATLLYFEIQLDCLRRCQHLANNFFEFKLYLIHSLKEPNAAMQYWWCWYLKLLADVKNDTRIQCIATCQAIFERKWWWHSIHHAPTSSLPLYPLQSCPDFSEILHGMKTCCLITKCDNYFWTSSLGNLVIAFFLP